MGKKKLDATETLTFTANDVALLIAGKRVVVGETELVLEEAADDQEPKDILEMINDQVEDLFEDENEEEEEENEEENYEEDNEEDEN